MQGAARPGFLVPRDGVALSGGDVAADPRRRQGERALPLLPCPCGTVCPHTLLPLTSLQHGMIARDCSPRRLRSHRRFPPLHRRGSPRAGPPPRSSTCTTATGTGHFSTRRSACGAPPRSATARATPPPRLASRSRRSLEVSPDPSPTRGTRGRLRVAVRQVRANARGLAELAAPADDGDAAAGGLRRAALRQRFGGGAPRSPLLSTCCACL